MKAIRVMAFVALIGLALGIAMVGDALAGESGKVVVRDVMFAASFPSAKVPDVEGHVIYLVDAKGIHFSDKWGVASAVCCGTTEYIKGVGPITGYYVYTFPDGSTNTIKYQGEAKGVPPGSTGRRGGEVTWTYVRGTGKFEGIKGGGTSKFWVVAPGLWYTEAEGEYALP